jgi:phage terminase large subunit
MGSMATQTATRTIIDLGYRCRPQFVAFHKRKQRWACIVAHRRAGKTVACIMDLVDEALRCQKPNPRFAYIAPLFTQAKDVAWTYLKQYTGDIPGVSHNESELRVDLPNGARVRLYGAENYNRLRGLYLDGVILDEAADMDPRAWSEVIRPALSDRKGWAVFIGTPKGRNSFYEIMYGSEQWPGAERDDDWFAVTLRASETGLVAPEELADARKVMTPEQYEQEYECSFDAAIVGAYYGKQMSLLEKQKRITSVPWEPSLPVYTAWDLGLDDATAVWFAQVAGTEVRLIDYVEYNDTALSEVARALKNEKPYTYGDHYLPHDAEIRELMTAKSRKESLESLGLRPIVIAPRTEVAEGINAAHNMLPRCVFDAKNCNRGIEALKQYRREWDDKRKVYHTRPLHDWTSHAADAFRYLAMCLRPKKDSPLNRPNRARVHVV